MTSKPTSEWDASEIGALASASGKPLEVQVAQAFLGKQWSAQLGTHYAESDSDPARELDVFAEWSRRSDALNATIRVRAMVSCRGFPDNRSPLCYSLGSSVPGGRPALLTKYHLSRQPAAVVTPYQTLPSLEHGMAVRLLHAFGLIGSERIVAWSVIEREERVPKGRRDAGFVETYRRASDGDRSIFPALDSAVSAAMSWITMDRSIVGRGYYITLHIPICVFQIPFWQVSIEGGKIGGPMVVEQGYQTNSYPHLGHYKEVLTVVCSPKRISDLVVALDEVANEFTHEVERL